MIPPTPTDTKGAESLMAEDRKNVVTEMLDEIQDHIAALEAQLAEAQAQRDAAHKAALDYQAQFEVAEVLLEKAEFRVTQCQEITGEEIAQLRERAEQAEAKLAATERRLEKAEREVWDWQKRASLKP